jgi:large subunit ribosomal protein L21
MYAVVESGGKQYRVEEGTVLVVDRLEAEQGDKITLRPVLVSGDSFVVKPDELEKIKVEAKVNGHKRGDKIKVFKYKAKKGYSRRAGHRAELTELEVTSLGSGAKKKAAPKKAAAKADDAAPKAEAKVETEAKTEAAAKKPAAKKPAAKKPAAKKPAEKKAPAKKPAAKKDAAEEGAEKAKPKAAAKPKAPAKPKAKAADKTEEKAPESKPAAEKEDTDGA